MTVEVEWTKVVVGETHLSETLKEGLAEYGEVRCAIMEVDGLIQPLV